MAKIALRVLDRFASRPLEFLKIQGGFSVDTEPFQTASSEIEGLLVRSTCQVDESFLRDYPKLKAVITSTSGTDHLNFEALRARNIVAMSTPSSNKYSACELTWALIFACLRPIIASDKRMKEEKGWRSAELMGEELYGKSLGIVGLGRVGQLVALAAKAFGCNLLAHDPYQEQDVFEKFDAERVGLDELLRCSQIVTLHVPLTEETRRMLHRVYLENLAEGSILINTSRGEIIKEEEILYALQKNWVARVGLDVFEREPLSPKSALRSHPRVVLTPHLGASTHQALERSCFEAAHKMVEFFQEGKTSDVLEPV